jgi:uncharacterized protein YkwD
LIFLLLASTGGQAAAHNHLLAAVNQTRQSHGLAALRPSPALQRAAQAQAQDLAARGVLEHENAAGDGLGVRLGQVGYAFATAAENLALGQSSPDDVVADWMQSSGHRANLLLEDATEAGAIRVDGKEINSPPNTRPIYWVLIVAQPAR